MRASNLSPQNAALCGSALAAVVQSRQFNSCWLRLAASPRCANTSTRTYNAFHTTTASLLCLGFSGFGTVTQSHCNVNTVLRPYQITPPVEIHNRSRASVKRLANRQDWQEYEDVTQANDTPSGVDLLDVFDNPETDYAERPPSSELFSSEALPSFLDDQKLAKRLKDEPQTIDELLVLDGCEGTSDLTEVGKIYDWLKSRGRLSSFGKFMASASDGDRLVTESTLMDSIGLTASKLSPKKWGLSGSSVIALVISIALFSFLEDSGIDVRPAVALVLALGFYDAVYLGGTGLTQVFSMWLPYQRRVLVHEAGHVLVAYLMGCPIRGVILNPIQAAKSGIQGLAGTQFWDKTLDMELSQNRLTGSTMDRYSTVLFAGIAAEAFVYGEAQGGENDENLFKSVVSQIQPSWSPAKMSNQARWAVLHAFLLIKENKRAHEAVIEALQQGAGLSSVIRAIEEAMS